MIRLKRPQYNTWGFRFNITGAPVLNTKEYKARDSAVKCLKALKKQADAGNWRLGKGTENGQAIVTIKSGNGTCILDIPAEGSEQTLAVLRGFLRANPYYDYNGNKVTFGDIHGTAV